MAFIGKAEKLSPSELASLSDEFDLSEAHIRTVMEVETSGKGFERNGVPTFLFEPHRFYAELKKAQDKRSFDEAVKTGLAYPTWRGPGSYPKTPELRWAQFQKAYALNQKAAIRAASWGLGQIMGSEFAEAGFGSETEMVTAFSDSEYKQLRGMCNLIRKRGLDRDLRNFPDIGACRHFALRYNGAAYERNNYHTKLQSAFNRWNTRLKQVNTPMLANDGVLRVGSTGQRVKALQNTLAAKGYKIVGKADSKYGNLTRDAVNAFKADAGLPLNGEMNAEDLLALDNFDGRPISEERASTTAADLKKDSSIIQTTSLAKKVGAGVIAVEGVAQASDVGGLLDDAQGVADKAYQVKGIWGTVKSFVSDTGLDYFFRFVVDHKFIILLAIVVVGLFAFNYVEKKRVQMHKDAEVG